VAKYLKKQDIFFIACLQIFAFNGIQSYIINLKRTVIICCFISKEFMFLNDLLPGVYNE